jgi:hypothetical protein
MVSVVMFFSPFNSFSSGPTGVGCLKVSTTFERLSRRGQKKCPGDGEIPGKNAAGEDAAEEKSTPYALSRGLG